jgi:hypothetical protein
MTTIRELMGRITQGVWALGEYSDTIGYDSMTGGIRAGRVVLDGHDYGQQNCTEMAPDAFAQMSADARAIALLPELLALAAAVVDLEEKAAAYQKATTGPERNCTWSAVEMARKIKLDALSALQAKLEAK